MHIHLNMTNTKSERIPAPPEGRKELFFAVKLGSFRAFRRESDRNGWVSNAKYSNKVTLESMTQGQYDEAIGWMNRHFPLTR